MGFTAKKNIYTCKVCGWHCVTVDLVDGVTPFGIPCEECAGCGDQNNAYSSMYRVDQNLRPTHEWYKPDKIEAKKLGKLWKQHLEAGGLKLRKAESRPKLNLKPQAVTSKES